MYSIELSARKNSQGKYPVRIRVWGPSRKDVSKRSETTITLKTAPCTKDEWSKESRRYKRTVKDFKLMNAALGVIEKKCEDIKKQLSFKTPIGTIEDFKELYTGTYNKVKERKTVEAKFREVIQERELSGNIKTAGVFKTSLNTWRSYTKEDVTLEDLDFNTIKKYILYMKGKGYRNGTIRIRLADLQTIYNEEDKIGGIAPGRPHPFKYVDWGKYRKVSKEHDDMDVELFRHFMSIKTKPGYDTLFKDMYIFMVYANGMNFKDLVYLEKKDIYDKYIIYNRSKVEHKIIVPLHEKTRAILEKYTTDTKYAFPIHDGRSRDRKREQEYYNGRLRRCGAVLRRLTKDDERFDGKNITPYTARHTFANIAFNAGASMGDIRKSLGHTTEQMTLAYLKKRNLLVQENNLLKDI